MTDKAYSELKSITQMNNKQYARLEVKGGGCAGFEYDWSTTDSRTESDTLVRELVIVDKMFELYLIGLELDYYDDGFNKSFKFNNPNAKSQCGCGTSFTIDPDQATLKK